MNSAVLYEQRNSAVSQEQRCLTRVLIAWADTMLFRMNSAVSHVYLSRELTPCCPFLCLYSMPCYLIVTHRSIEVYIVGVYIFWWSKWYCYSQYFCEYNKCLSLGTYVSNVVSFDIIFLFFYLIFIYQILIPFYYFIISSWLL